MAKKNESALLDAAAKAAQALVDGLPDEKRTPQVADAIVEAVAIGIGIMKAQARGEDPVEAVNTLLQITEKARAATERRRAS